MTKTFVSVKQKVATLTSLIVIQIFQLTNFEFRTPHCLNPRSYKLENFPIQDFQNFSRKRQYSKAGNLCEQLNVFSRYTARR